MNIQAASHGEGISLSKKEIILICLLEQMYREKLGWNIVNSIYKAGKILFILDNTQEKKNLTDFGRYKIVNPLNTGVKLCDNLFEVSSAREISRLRSLLTELGFEASKVMKVVQYLSIVKETEKCLGNQGPLCMETLEEYSGSELVKWKMGQLVNLGKLTTESYTYLLTRYAEVRAAAADFEMFLVMLAPFIEGDPPCPETAIHLTIGEFASDRPMQQVMCRIILSFIKKNPEVSSVLILDDGKGNRDCIIDLLKNLPVATEAHMLTGDAFSLSDSDRDVLMSTFPVRIYSRHESMESCSKIEACCGQIDVVKHSYTTTVDKRIRASTALDMLFGTNRTEAEIRNAPVREARYRKEMIHSLCLGTAIIDCGGTQVLFRF